MQRTFSTLKSTSGDLTSALGASTPTVNALSQRQGLFFHPQTIIADLEIAASHTDRSYYWIDHAIDDIRESVSRLEPVIIGQFKPDEKELAAIDKLLATPDSLPILKLLPPDLPPQEAQEAITQYLKALIAYTTLRNHPLRYIYLHSVEALRASDKLVSLLGISPDDIIQMESRTTDSPLRDSLYDQVTIFITILQEYSPESFADKR